jgi:hypothetical protein
MMGSVYFIEKFGEFIKGLFRKVGMFIMPTKIVQTINLTILKYLHPKLMLDFMALPRAFLFASQSCIPDNAVTVVSGLSYQSPHESSSAANGADLLIGEDVKFHKLSRVRSVFASCVGYLLKQSEKMQNIALGNVRQQVKIEPYMRPNITENILKNTNALNLRESIEISNAGLQAQLALRNTQSQLLQATRPDITKNILKSGSNLTKSEKNAVVSNVRRLPAQEFVYDIQVAQGYLPEFFANGICVHNSSEGEIRTWYDSVGAMQERFFRPNLTTVIDFIMLDLWGEVDQEITFSFVPLWSLDEEKMSAKRKTDADTDVTLIDAGIISPAEARARVAADEDSPYSSIDVDDLPEPPQQEGMGESEGGGEEPSSSEKDSFAGSGGEKPAVAASVHSSATDEGWRM